MRRALLAAAARLLEAHGPAALSLREVARATGVSQTAPYRHFADKEALLAALAADGFAELLRRMTEAAAGADAPPERLQALGRGYVDFALAHPHVFRLMFGPEIPDRRAHPALFAAAAAAEAQLGAAIAACRRGMPRDAADERTALVAAWSLVHGLATLLIGDQFRRTEATARTALVDGVTRLFARMLAGSPAG
ncbi:MAG TPA: TetR/AcrR family transcriptional regulator [Alphaproteobacteria bacterium]